jgi:hypothetical protein
MLPACLDDERIADRLGPMFAFSNAGWAANARGRLIEKMRQRLAADDYSESGQPDRSVANLPPADPEPKSDALWDMLIGHASTTDRKPTAPPDDLETLARLETVVLGLLDAFSLYRRGMLISLLLGLSVSQTSRRHGCTGRTVKATLDVAMDLLGQPGA